MPKLEKQGNRKRSLKDIEKEAYWRELLAEHKASGCIVRQFCIRKGIDEKAFYRWRRIIAKRELHAPKQTDKSINPFIRVVAGNKQSVEIKLPGAAVISIKHDSDLPLVVKMLKALEAVATC